MIEGWVNIVVASQVSADAAGASQMSADAAGASQDESNPVAPSAPPPSPEPRLRSSSVTVAGNTTASKGAGGVSFQYVHIMLVVQVLQGLCYLS